MSVDYSLLKKINDSAVEDEIDSIDIDSEKLVRDLVRVISDKYNVDLRDHPDSINDIINLMSSTSSLICRVNNIYDGIIEYPYEVDEEESEFLLDYFLETSYYE